MGGSKLETRGTYVLTAFKQTVDFHLGSTCYQAVIKIRNMEHGQWTMDHSGTSWNTKYLEHDKL